MIYEEFRSEIQPVNIRIIRNRIYAQLMAEI